MKLFKKRPQRERTENNYPWNPWNDRDFMAIVRESLRKSFMESPTRAGCKKDNPLVKHNIGERFLTAKFGDNMIINFSGHEKADYEGRRVGGSLVELLNEFAQILGAGELMEAQNPRTKTFTLVDKSRGTVIGSYENSFLND